MTFTPVPFDESELRRALETANLPTLLMVMFQLSGDRRWLADPYRPVRTKGMSDNDTGGFSPEVQAEVRQAAAQLLTAWSNGAPMAHPLPDDALLLEMITTCMGEAVPEEFGPMFAEDMRAVIGGGQEPVQVAGAERYTALVVGAGVSGIAATAELQAIGVDVTVVEKNPEVGGTWLENSYPGCGVDTPSYVYTLSNYPRQWSTYYGKRDEILDYVSEVADESGVRARVRFNTEVISATYDEATQRWRVESRDPEGNTVYDDVNILVCAVGQLNRPAIPVIAGAESFGGQAFHSAQWPEGLDVAGMKVGVVGSGASAMQIVPAIADQVEHLTVFQRSPQWIAPSYNYSDSVPDAVHWLLEHVPNYHLWYRLRLSWLINDRVHPALVIDPDWEHPDRSINAANDGHRRALTRYITEQLDGREDLLAKSVPEYPPFGKRMLLDNGWYAALRKPGVDLVTDPVESIDEGGVVTSAGEHVDLDVLVYATGFEAKRLLHPMDIRGRDGRAIRDVWGDEDARAYLGITVPGFPNLFVMYGPNINLGHGGSYMFVGECQARYVAALVARMAENGAGALEVRREVHDAYNDKVDAAHEQMIWSHRGMNTWYRNSQGRVVTNSPWRVVDYWRMTKEVVDADFVYEAAAHADAEPR